MSQKLKVSEGDWICGNKDCGNINFSRRSSCNKCGQGKDTRSQVIKQTGAEIGKGLASKSKGLFSADDWQCGKCGNINWARRVTCNICNAAKFGAEEARTGLGGGYNERENVEYYDREESDGEYDEFGRKKKKYRDHKSGEEPGNKRDELREKKEQEKEEEDEEDEEEEGDASKYDLEEEEEDEEDVDLSKYDLSESEEDIKPHDTKTAQKRGRPRSRSSSRSPKPKRSRASSGSSSSSSGSSASSRSSSSSSDSRSRSRSPSSRRRSRSSSPRSKEKTR